MLLMKYMKNQICIHNVFITGKAKLKIIYTVSKKSVTTLSLIVRYPVCLQCFDTVGWAAGRATGL